MYKRLARRIVNFGESAPAESVRGESRLAAPKLMREERDRRESILMRKNEGERLAD
jgi:hypothetical protein